MKSNVLALFTLLLLLGARYAAANANPENPGPADISAESSGNRQSRADAWWTGPLLAASPGTLPPGHFLIEPYVFDAIPQGSYADDGTRRSGPHANNFGSQSYILYGLVDNISVGLIPRFAYNDPGIGRSSAGVRVGDLTLQGQLGLTHFEEGGWLPTTALIFQETLPTGRYDRLGDRPANGTGTGAYSSTLGLYSQYFFWMPNGRILRTRFDLSYQIFGSADVQDVSVYGTEEGFRGRARPGNVAIVNAAMEYSLTRNWVLAMDVVYEHDAGTHVRGMMPNGARLGSPSEALDITSRTGYTWSLAPAIEYNFNSRVGIIAGAKLTVAGRNATAIVIPVAAVNIVI